MAIDKSASEYKKLKAMLREDPAYKKFRQIYNYCTSLAEFDNLVTELETMHKGRKSRDLHLKTPTVQRIQDAAMQGSSYRSRCVEIMFNIQKASRLLEAAIDRIETHVLVKYKAQVAVAASTVSERKTFVKDIFQSAHYKMHDYQRMLDMVKAIVEDIDQAAWALKHCLDGLQLLYQRESIVGSIKEKNI